MSPEQPKATTENQPAKSSVDIEEHVRRRAFELYELRGREGGRELDDWLQAESELAQRKTKAAAV